MSLVSLLPEILQLIINLFDFQTSLNLRAVCKFFHSKFENVFSLWFKFEHSPSVHMVELLLMQLGFVYWKWNDAIHYIRIRHRYSKRRKINIIKTIAYYDSKRKVPKYLENHNKIHRFLKTLNEGRILVPFCEDNENLTACGIKISNQHLSHTEIDIKYRLVDIFNYLEPLQFTKLLSNSCDFLDISAVGVSGQLKMLNYERFLRDLNIALVSFLYKTKIDTIKFVL